MKEARIITTCTRDCANTCGLVATVRDGRLVKLAGDPGHPLTKGVACVKAARYVRRVYNPERVTTPLIRAHRGDSWRRASWDEVLDTIAARMKAIAAESGPEAILYYQGYGERTALKLLNRYFFNLFGGVTTPVGSLCGGTGQGSQNLDFGERVSHDPLDHYNSRSMILWGRNPASTNISLVPIIRSIRKGGGMVVLIDPAPSKSVALVDRHIAIRPGTDAYLAMALAKLVLRAGAEDRTFMTSHAEGAADYLRILERFTLEELSARCDVSVADMQFLTGMLIQGKPTSMLLGWGMHRHEEAHFSIRAIDALGALSGNIGVPGGGVSQGFEEYGPYDQRFWGNELNPPRRTLLLPRIGEEILNARNPEIRMIFVTAANPVCMAPNTAKMDAAFRKPEFVVYSGHFMDDTADLAHVFLPATTFLEEEDVMASYGHNYVGPVNPAIPPVGQCRSEFRMFHDLAGRFPFARQFQRDEREWLCDLCAPIREQGCELENLRSGAFRLDAPMVPYAGNRFPTPSGKFRFMTEFSPRGLGVNDPDYPYRLLTIAPHGFICSERTMAEHESVPVVILAAAEAQRIGLRDGALVRVESPTGAIRARLGIRVGQRPDILVAERGGWAKAGHAFNRLTRDMASVIGRGTPFYETSVRVLADLNSARRILVIEHGSDAPGGVFRKALERMGAEVETVRPPEGQAMPDSPEGYDGLVVLGGLWSAADESAPYFSGLLRLMRDFDAAGKPVAGICLGCQLLATAWGGRVRPMDSLEFGFISVQATEKAQSDPVLAGVELPALMSFHADTFSLPEDADLLLRGEQCCNQCFRIGKASYGFQFHLEVDAAIVESWAALFRSTERGCHADGTAQFGEEFFNALRSNLPLLAEASERFCRRVAENYLRLIQ
jgi:anaerobic selenocysteine-containing dehydrogenase/GMP synthase-like glutamine amidotransferase